MKLLQPTETELIGRWSSKHGRMRGDGMCDRIDLLTSQVLKKVGVGKESGGWETLFEDPTDGRFWCLTYPQGEMHGGGPPKLVVVAQDEVAIKFDISSPDGT